MLTWTAVRMRIPDDPDRLLDLPEVQAANRRDDYMPYWSTLWPAAVSMANALPRADWPTGTEMVELGCGLGLVGIAAALRGWRVQLTDVDPLALAAARHNLELNGVAHAVTAPLDWRAPWSSRFPVILACDVLYERRLHRPVLGLLDGMLGDGGECWIGDPGRSVSLEFLPLAAQAGYRVQAVDLSTGDMAGWSVPSTTTGARVLPPAPRFQLWELTRRER
jgi:predicted nicotinamide N-methyase